MKPKLAKTQIGLLTVASVLLIFVGASIIVATGLEAIIGLTCLVVWLIRRTAIRKVA